MNLADLVGRGAERHPDSIAVRDPEHALTYRELDVLADRFARALHDHDVRTGDRIAISLHKSALTIAAMQGVLRVGAAYVPLDPTSPATRVRKILRDCDVRLLITSKSHGDRICAADLEGLPVIIADPEVDPRRAELPPAASPPLPRPRVAPEDLAYILYTSGSTGHPKGVCISHRNAFAFIDWAVAELQATASDRFCNQAPLSCDLSVLDLYAAFRVGASVTLIPEQWAYTPGRIVDLVVSERISIWYSVPSVLVMMMDHGGLMETHSNPLRVVLFAGEPFRMKYLEALVARWPQPRYLNLYGPTETNVCTFYEVRPSDLGGNEPLPIGQACSGDIVWAIKEDGSVVEPEQKGELIVAGPTVMLGYWGRSAQRDAPYATGDIVKMREDGNYVYVARRDLMVKIRGHRVELPEIEMALEEHPAVDEAAVIAVGDDMNKRLVAFLTGVEQQPSFLLEAKQHCADRLQSYMNIDELRWIASLPRTQNGKIDRQALSREPYMTTARNTR